jgi:hypothetical protein
MSQRQERQLMNKLINALNYANVMATVAIFLALGGAAFAVTKAAKNSVTSASIKNGAVKGKDVKDNSLVGADLAANAVESTKIADGSVGAADLTATEPYHVVGTPGEPQFFDGGEGDCVWENGYYTASGTGPASFAKDVLGQVHLHGILTATSGTGGDGACDPQDTGEAEDGVVFVLPGGYRPALLDFSGADHGIVLAPDAGATINDVPIQAGAVYASTARASAGGGAVLDGVLFTASTGRPQTAGAPAEVPLQALRRLSR